MAVATVLGEEFVVAGGGRVFQGVESPSRRGEEEAGHKECVGSTAVPRQEHVGCVGGMGDEKGSARHVGSVNESTRAK